MYNFAYQRPQRSLSQGRLIIILIFGVLAFGLLSLSLWLHSQTQSYYGFHYNIKVGQVRVRPTIIPHLMLAQFILTDGSQNQSNVPGDEVKLEGNIITCPGTDTCSGVLNVFGLHSGYKLTHWIGHYTSISKSDSNLDINSGDDNFFGMVSNHPTPIVSATEISSNFLRPDGKTYNLFVSPTGLLLISSN